MSGPRSSRRPLNSLYRAFPDILSGPFPSFHALVLAPSRILSHSFPLRPTDTNAWISKCLPGVWDVQYFEYEDMQYWEHGDDLYWEYTGCDSKKCQISTSHHPQEKNFVKMLAGIQVWITPVKKRHYQTN